MRFNYYYGDQADQFSFIRIPKLMLTNEIFSTLSLHAKVLYAVLLDRMSLSMKNKWLDEENRVYIIYQIGEIQEDLGFSRKKAMSLLIELEEFGLLEKKRRGHGLPNILYLKSFLFQPDSRSVQNGTSGRKEVDLRSAQNGTSRSVEIGTQEVPEMGLHEVSKMGHLKSYTKVNNKYLSNTQSNLISSTENDEIGLDKISDNATEEYRELIKSNIAYEDLIMTHPYDQGVVDEIIELMLEVLLSQKDTIVIASDQYPAELVKGKLLKINYSNISYVLECLQRNTSKVNNIKKYMLAALFNAPSTMNSYYRTEVNHDIYGTQQ